MTTTLTSRYMKMALAAALTMGAAFSASAHLPKEGEPGYKMLEKHKDFILQMKRKGFEVDPSNMGTGKCCDDKDAFISLPEKQNKDGSIEVYVTKGTDGQPLATPFWQKIEESQILRADHALNICEQLKAATGTTTCVPPPFSITWTNAQGTVWCHWQKPKLGIQ